MHVILLSKQLENGEAISEYIKSLSGFLVDKGVEVTVVSFDDGSYFSLDERVNLKQFPLHFDGSNIFNWSMIMNNELKGEAMQVIKESEADIIHSCGWTTVPGAVTLSKHTEIPFVFTIHSTENQRGFGGEHSPMISDMEWQGAYNSEKVLATDEEVKHSLVSDLDVPQDKIEVINPLAEDWQGRVLKTYREVSKNKRKVEQ